jgi:hypothetical protein
MDTSWSEVEREGEEEDEEEELLERPGEDAPGTVASATTMAGAGELLARAVRFLPPPSSPPPPPPPPAAADAISGDAGGHADDRLERWRLGCSG